VGTPSTATVPLRYDVTIKADSTLRVDSNLAHVVASADLVLRGTYDRPLLFGRVEVDQGEAIFEGKRYLVRHGSVDFSNPTKIEPFFDLEAETMIRAPGQMYVVNAQAIGTIDRMEPVLTSDPPLPQLEILALLFGGDTARAEARDAELRTLQREQSQRDLVTSRLQQTAVGVVTAPLTKAVEQTFGLDAFQITPSMGSDPYQRFSPTARVTMGKRISRKVYLTFSHSLNSPGGADQLILLEYDQNERISWIFSRNEDNTYALDVRVRHVF
jgi:autotransporter translocation and assembly factor TamB